MWIPTSEDDIERAVAAGDLKETPSFDAKLLPGKSKDIARDIAAMAVDGGVILYGVGEDANKRLTIRAPFTLAGQPERIDQIARTSISESPTYRIQTFPSASDSAVGYIVVIVPASPRAPHMVTVDKDFRFYGRSATGNTILSEGEVARLYERRQRWEVDRDALLDKEVKASPFPVQEGAAYLHLIAKPVVHDEDFIERIKLDPALGTTLDRYIRAAMSDSVFPYGGYAPDFHVNFTWTRHADGYFTGMADNPLEGTNRKPQDVLDLSVDYDGTIHLFCGRAGDVHRDHLCIIEVLIAGLTTRFIKFAGDVYGGAQYFGAVDIGLALTGLANSVSAHLARGVWPERGAIGRDEYRRTTRVTTIEMETDPQRVAADLTMRFIRAATHEQFDPFASLRPERR